MKAFTVPNPLPIGCTDCHQPMRVEFQSAIGNVEWSDAVIVAAECKCGRAIGIVSEPTVIRHNQGRPITRADIDQNCDLGKSATERIASARERIAEWERWIAAATWANGGRTS